MDVRSITQVDSRIVSWKAENPVVRTTGCELGMGSVSCLPLLTGLINLIKLYPGFIKSINNKH